MKLSVHVCVILAAAAVLSGGTSPSGRETVLLEPTDVVARAEADTALGQYYTISYRLPRFEASIQLDCALLELYVDVRAKVRDSYVNEAPVLEVCALREAFTGSVELDNMDTETRATRAVALGKGRRVLIDITQIVRAHLRGTVPNNGLLVGSLTGRRDGDFTVVANRLPDGAIGRIRIYVTSVQLERQTQ